jgi:putative intracellular protease/amidase
VLVFDNVEDIDFAGPYEVFGESGARIFTVAPTTAEIRTTFGMQLRPTFDLQHAPAADVILIPGGGIGQVLKNDKVLNWVRERAASSRYVLTVCNGSFIAAKSGILDGLTATTTAHNIEKLIADAPKTHVVRDRITDNGKVITSGGLSAGIDGALHVLEREHGRQQAEEVARGMEYHWQPELNWTPAAFALSRLPDVKLPSDAAFEKISSKGDIQQWELRGRLHTSMALEEFLDYATKDVATKGWTLRDSAKGKRTFVNSEGTWQVTLASSPDSDPFWTQETISIAKTAVQ